MDKLCHVHTIEYNTKIHINHTTCNRMNDSHEYKEDILYDSFI